MKSQQTSTTFIQEVEQATELMVKAYESQKPEEKAEAAKTRSLTPTVRSAAKEVDHLMKLSAEFISEMLDIPIELIVNQSSSGSGFIGFLNKINRALRERKYKRKIKKDPLSTRIVSEGDSWFQYPIYIKDIIDWLIKEDSFAINSLGAGGDWLYNILTQREYFKALETSGNPKFLLISGGGNDLLQSGRIAHLLNPYSRQAEVNPLLYLNDDFFSLIKLLRFLYTHLFMELDALYPNLKIISHGYDYAFPSDKIGFHPIEAILRLITGNGQWLKRPMESVGIKNSETQHQIVKHLIDNFNQMHSEVAATFKNVYYINLRGFAHERDYWHDEIHPDSQRFRQMARAYQAKIKALTDWGD